MHGAHAHVILAAGAEQAGERMGTVAAVIPAVIDITGFTLAFITVVLLIAEGAPASVGRWLRG